MPNGTRRRGSRPGFTMIELLTVIGIIIILMAILLPVMGVVRRKSQETDTWAEIEKLQTACNHYYNDFTAYPGPIPDSMLMGYNGPLNTMVSINNTSPSSGPLGVQTINVTSSQNLTLGLLGGLANMGTSATPPFVFNAALIPSGPGSLSQLNVRQYPPYFEPNRWELYTVQGSTGAPAYTSWLNANNTTQMVIPEIMDHFSSSTKSNWIGGMPLIYLRAKTGAPYMVDNGGAANSPYAQYYSGEMSMYGYTFPTPPDANHASAVYYTYPINFFQNPSLSDGLTPRSKDTYIIISAGFDGIYGTYDDIVYSN